MDKKNRAERFLFQLCNVFLLYHSKYYNTYTFVMSTVYNILIIILYYDKHNIKVSLLYCYRFDIIKTIYEYWAIYFTSPCTASPAITLLPVSSFHPLNVYVFPFLVYDLGGAILSVVA